MTVERMGNEIPEPASGSAGPRGAHGLRSSKAASERMSDGKCVCAQQKIWESPPFLWKAGGRRQQQQQVGGGVYYDS